MADFMAVLQDTIETGTDFVIKIFNQAVKATKLKVNELSSMGKRRDLVNELGTKMLELNKAGTPVPAEAAALIEQIIKLDDDLETMRSTAAAEKAAADEAMAARKAARAAEMAASRAAAAIRQSTAPVDIEMTEVDVPAAEVDASMSPEASASVIDVQTEMETVPVLDLRPEAPDAGSAGADDVPTLKI